MRDGEDRLTTTHRDELGWVTRIDHPDGTDESIASYDANGNVLVRRDGNGQTITSTWDALDRLRTRDYDGEAEATDIVRETWTYSANGEPERIEQHEQGGTIHVTQREWDRQGRLHEDRNRHDQSTTQGFDA